MHKEIERLAAKAREVGITITEISLTKSQMNVLREEFELSWLKKDEIKMIHEIGTPHGQIKIIIV